MRWRRPEWNGVRAEGFQIDPRHHIRFKVSFISHPNTFFDQATIYSEDKNILTFRRSLSLFVGLLRRSFGSSNVTQGTRREIKRAVEWQKKKNNM